MKDYSNQEAEIATIKKRNISISLSDADCDRLAIKAGTVGLTVDELLRNFIGDLVDGTYSNGSDERMYANQWFERCGFSYFSESTLLSYLLNNSCNGIDDVRSLMGIYYVINKLKTSIAHLEQNSKDCDYDIQDLKEELEEYLIDYNICIEYFLEKHPDADIEKEIALCKKWLDEYENIISEKANS